MEHTKSYYERLINSESLHDRWQALKAGYGLDQFVHDPDWTNRAEVARQGFGLDLLARDPEPYVQGIIREYLTQHKLTLENWIRENPDKCIYPLMKKQMREAGLQVAQITLLTADEAAKYAPVISKWEDDFWVQPGSHPVYSNHHAFTVGPNYLDRVSSLDTAHSLAEVRPALRMKNYGSLKLHQGDNISLLGNMWTVLDASPNDVLLLSDKSFGTRHYGKAGPYYETSDIKKQLDGWLEWKLGDDERKPSLAFQIRSAQSLSDAQSLHSNSREKAFTPYR